MFLSIIIPCYNEEKDIFNKTKIVQKYLKDNSIEAEIILVDDGSKDNTKKVIESIDGVIALSYTPNRGKGGAIKYGIERSKGDYILFMDADLSTDLSAIKEFIPLLPNYDMVIGSRHAKDSIIKIKQPLKRIIIGRMCRILCCMKFNWGYKDTQCGFKAMKRNIALDIIKRQTTNGFAFDVEYLYIAKLRNYSVKEKGIIWSDDRGSTIKSPLKASFRFFKQMNKIKKNKNIYLED